MRLLTHSRTAWLAAVLIPALFAGVSRAEGQTPADRPPVPQIVVSASEEVEVTPDRASVSFAVETRGRTAAAAGSENARIQSAVIDSLKKLGIAAAQIRTQGVNINPEYEYPSEGGRPKVVGYQARNSVQVEVRIIGNVGRVIDAGLAKGATNVGGLHFFASNVDEARREAMSRAVARAKADATAMATAAGGVLGGVLELSAQPTVEAPIAYAAAPMRAMMRAEKDEPTPVETGVLKVSVTILARFQFLMR